ncbi:YibE/F family protein [Sporosalibacterium faouarense]|uniref:YibE/F family protein n=1 Tax=Sporosalibacterium faouarense TaxID=516123 RepID=UPI00141D28D4|nr:YibE/F family protein [Sporosalibacterium faouarense]MTI46713.1 YibE/F family protein [Bacillota bacterium]
MKKKTMPLFIILVLIISIVGLFIYDGTPNNTEKKDNNITEVKAKVLSVDNSDVVRSGISSIGHQNLKAEVKEGKYKGYNVDAKSNLIGKLDMDTFVEEGDTIVLGLREKDNLIKDAIVLEHYRHNWLLIMFGVFVICLILYARIIGIKALFSFIASLYVIWGFLIPGLLNGKNPLVLATLVLMLLSAIIIFSVAGFTRKGVSAFVGTMMGLIITIAITIFFGEKLGLRGMTQPFAESLLFSGHLNLNMKHILYAAIIIGASGAAMDIAMDITASMEEIKSKKPEISTKELIQSGFNVGRSVIGTMTTTLLLAYSGGYLTLLMLFMTKDSSFIRIVNLKIVSTEIMRTVVGSIGLVLVAPLTAVFGGWILTFDFKRFRKTVKTYNKSEEISETAASKE